jgi:hypothetical protein
MSTEKSKGGNAASTTRREALCRIGNGFGMLAFAGMVGESLARAGADEVRKLDHPATLSRRSTNITASLCQAAASPRSAKPAP